MNNACGANSGSLKQILQNEALAFFIDIVQKKIALLSARNRIGLETWVNIAEPTPLLKHL